MVRKAVDRASRVAALASGVAVLFMMLSVALDVVLRNLGVGGVPGVIEYNEVALVGFVYLSLAYAQLRGAHVSTELVTSRLPFRIRESLTAVGLVVIGVVLVWLMAAAAQEAVSAFQVREYRFGLIRVPIWPARITVPVGVFLLVLQVCFQLGDRVRGAIRGHDEGATRA